MRDPNDNYTMPLSLLTTPAPRAPKVKWQPMLAATYTADKPLKFPAFRSIKVDGLRCVLTPNGASSRSGKAFPNSWIDHAVVNGGYVPKTTSDDWLDGELILYKKDMSPQDPASHVPFQVTQGWASRIGMKAPPDGLACAFLVFDSYTRFGPWSDWALMLAATRASSATKSHVECNSKNAVASLGGPIGPTASGTYADVEGFRVLLLEQQLVEDESAIAEIPEHQEGWMLRHPGAFYKYGRATPITQELVKVKATEHDTATVTGWIPLMVNHNPAEENAAGHLKRSSKQALQEVDETRMGALRVRMNHGPFTGTEVLVGTGFTDVQRRLCEKWVGSTIMVEYMLVGAKDRPRAPRLASTYGTPSKVSYDDF